MPFSIRPKSVLALVLCAAACGDAQTPIGGGWYEGRRAALDMDDRGAKGLLFRQIGDERIQVGTDVFEYRFYPPDCVLWMTGRTLFGACGDRRPLPLAISGSLDWEFKDDGAHYLGIFKVQGGRQPPKVPTLISIDMVRTAVKSQDRLDASYQPVRDGGPNFSPAVAPVEVEMPIDVDATNEKKETVLHVAARTRDRTLLERALKAGARVNAGDYLNATALVLALSGSEPVDSTIVERLLDAGTDINKPNDHGFTPLMMAAQYAPIDVVQRLLARGADPRARDDDGAAAYDHADWARPDRQETVRILREAARERDHVQERP